MWAMVVAGVSVVATIALVAWFVLTPKQPETAASHWDEHVETVAEQLYGRHPSGPAGADAESQRPEDTGNAWQT
jgi:hypothetical protein